MTYDPPSTNEKFRIESELSYPLLSDSETKTVSALGIKNEDYEPGHPAYGIPHPGMVFVTPDKIIRLKRAESSYRNRPPLDEVLSAVTEIVQE